MPKEKPPHHVEGRTPGESNTCMRCSARVFDSTKNAGFCHIVGALQRHPDFKPPFHCPTGTGRSVKPNTPSVALMLSDLVRRRG